ncbi:rod shape-determining protein MreC [Halalkalibacterium halodurans]|jgi:rod shape-determining protein MreC|uniref:Cell shape-determining protein MreC n=2 Tax=Halalkalibacterium halodurans TaxID=86665 RepID=Q9K8H6_HALH5|nr:rod shape-determining protein MreC [Halalkalibacterium halodurans]MDY7223575.1 rod shape-determining protein MreC [Halalkalibacterium halodurans]MDY7242796.1 rod shape-determining protein MreC [Halalkalibacterium halodurans]MED3646595.1 rod shape-determining protein MreC [Halalkalibacterium halodurans]MED4082217.1 rod shape-determining protein MreC [Halalkalibacterium halodurans]MED4084524.1 rod shape-determining protein MreC [Halalkalibacterium halodurans]
MPSFFSNKKLIVLLVSIIVLVALIGYSLSDRERLTWPERFLHDSVGWVQSIVMRPAHLVAGFFEEVSELRHLYEENQTLKARLEEYAQISVERNVLKEENESLREILDLEESLSDYRMRNAVVTFRSPDRWNEAIGINIGSQHGVEDDMAVVSSNGYLIGKIQRVSEFSSRVQLLTDTDRTNRVSARIDGDDKAGPVGFIEGYDDETGLLVMRKLEMDAEIEPGQLVSTSGLGTVYPRGIIIGEVERVEPDEYGLTQNAYIRPYADLLSLDYVIVIERLSTAMDPELIEEGGL